jgi:hypothetical protein
LGSSLHIERDVGLGPGSVRPRRPDARLGRGKRSSPRTLSRRSLRTTSKRLMRNTLCCRFGRWKRAWAARVADALGVRDKMLVALTGLPWECPPGRSSGRRSRAVRGQHGGRRPRAAPHGSRTASERAVAWTQQRGGSQGRCERWARAAHGGLDGRLALAGSALSRLMSKDRIDLAAGCDCGPGTPSSTARTLDPREVPRRPPRSRQRRRADDLVDERELVVQRVGPVSYFKWTFPARP